MKNPTHSSKTAEHFTPHEIIARARDLLREIDLDPASCAVANEAVGAKTILSAADDGLRRAWHGNVFLNPPGGTDEKNRSNQKLWWHKLVAEWMSRRVRAAVFVGFSIELLQTCQVDVPQGLPLLSEFPFMIPRQCLRFRREMHGEVIVGASPTHANVIVFLPPSMEWGSYRPFERVFGDLGAVVLPRWRPVPLRPGSGALSTEFLRSITGRLNGADNVGVVATGALDALPRPEGALEDAPSSDDQRMIGC